MVGVPHRPHLPSLPTGEVVEPAVELPDEQGPLNHAPENVQRFRGGLVFKARRLLYHSILGLRVIKKKKKNPVPLTLTNPNPTSAGDLTE